MASRSSPAGFGFPAWFGMTVAGSSFRRFGGWRPGVGEAGGAGPGGEPVAEHGDVGGGEALTGGSAGADLVGVSGGGRESACGAGPGPAPRAAHPSRPALTG